MNARDTVLSEDDLMGAYENNNPTANHALGCKELAKCQADATWPIAEKVGIRKVVEWISQNIHLVVFPDNNFTNKWQTFLKEQGIEVKE